MRFFSVALLLIFQAILSIGLFSGFSSKAAAQDLDPREIRRAIDQGIGFLKDKQRNNGNWDEYPGERVGTTALVVLAMISCGVEKEDPSIQRAMNYLRLFRGRDAGQNYAISLQTMAFCLVDPDRDRAMIRENVEYLEKSQVRNGSEHDGGWHYVPRQPISSDLSNSQFSILALYEAERIGVSARRETWQKAYRYWDQTQNPNGSWDYTPSSEGGCRNTGGRGSMTCAGIASMVITSGVLGSGGASVKGDNIVCLQKTNHRAAAKIEAGLNWLANHFSVSQNPNFGATYLYYYLYALERVGRMTNHRFIGQDDWYRKGADKLLQLRDPIDGAWRGGHSEHDLVATSFALLFLSKGRRPVLMSKVHFGSDGSWNVHPNDANNITAFAESRWKIDLTWQTIKTDAATVDDLAQTPVLYLCGSRTPLPNDDKTTAGLAKKLRTYLDQGGFILAEAQPDDKSFDSGFRELMKQVFPEPGFELSLLDTSHPIWSAEIPVEPDQLRPIEGINFGCRTSVVYVPPYKDEKTNKQRPSLSCLWEVARLHQREDPYPVSVRRQVDAGLGIGLNILAYATNRELKFKDEIAETVVRKTTVSQERRGKLFLGVLNHAGGANSAPRAAVNLLEWTETNLGVPVDARGDLVDASENVLYEYPSLLMHGRNAFQFSERERDNLKKHLLSGGFLFVNSICSSKTFSDSFRNEMKKIIPESELEPIKIDDSLFSKDYGGFKIETLELRIPEQSPGRKIVAPTRKVVPELYGIKFEDRWVVVFSPNDVSCSLEMANSIECRGYTFESAMQLAVNTLLYSLGHW